MSNLTLYIGNYNYSSWSLRAWQILRKTELPFQSAVIDLDVPGYKDELLKLSDAGTVPVLDVNGQVIPDSLAIAEFCAKAVPNLWPKGRGRIGQKPRPLSKKCIPDLRLSAAKPP